MISNDDRLIIERGQDYLKSHLEQLLQHYEGHYIAILNDQIVDADKDISELAGRVYHKFGYQTIFMPFVSKEPDVTFVLSTIDN